MAIDPRQIELTDEQRQMLAELSEKAGRAWEEVYADALGSYSPPTGPDRTAGRRTLYDPLAADHAIGSICGGPHDVSTNPIYMEGFGRSDRQEDPD